MFEKQSLFTVVIPQSPCAEIYFSQGNYGLEKSFKCLALGLRREAESNDDLKHYFQGNFEFICLEGYQAYCAKNRPIFKHITRNSGYYLRDAHLVCSENSFELMSQSVQKNEITIIHLSGVGRHRRFALEDTSFEPKGGHAGFFFNKSASDCHNVRRFLKAYEGGTEDKKILLEQVKTKLEQLNH
jgi:hypothetical protein